MGEVAGLTIGLVVLVCLVAGEWTFARRVEDAGWRARAVRVLVVGLPVVALSPGWLIPWRGGWLALALALVGWGILRLSPLLVAIAEPRRLPSGRWVLGAGVIAALAVGAAGAARCQDGVPLWPCVLLLGGGALGVVLQQRGGGRGEGAALLRALSGWLLIEGSLLVALPFLR